MLENRERERDFLEQDLPFIVTRALEMPQRFPEGLLRMRKNVARVLMVTRSDCACILANMFLCTFTPECPRGERNGYSFSQLLEHTAPQEEAKLSMFLNYFRRIRLEEPLGSIRIVRKVEPSSVAPHCLQVSARALLPMVVREEGFIEDARGCIHADFANE